MVDPQSAGSDFDNALKQIGFSCVFKTWSQAQAIYSGTDYDEPYLPGSLTNTFSGAAAVFCLKGEERRFVKEGVLSENDMKLFCAGSLDIDGTTTISFPNGSVYGIVPNMGVHYESLSGSTVFNRMYVRIIPNGSPYGRY